MHGSRVTRILSTVIERSCSSVGKDSACKAGDPGSIPGLGRSPGGGNGNPLQYSCPGNPMDGGAWWATVHGVVRVGHNLVTKERERERSGGSSLSYLYFSKFSLYYPVDVVS